MSKYNIDLKTLRRGGSNGYPQSMFLSRNKKNNVYPSKSQFYYIKVGFNGVKIIQACFRDVVKDVLSDCGISWVFLLTCLIRID